MDVLRRRCTLGGERERGGITFLVFARSIEFQGIRDETKEAQCPQNQHEFEESDEYRY